MRPGRRILGHERLSALPPTVAPMARELQRVPASTALVGELVDPAGLAVRAAEVAARQRSPETRRTYAAVYRSFGAFLGPDATAEDLTAEAVRAYRDALERAGRSPATVAKHLSALRGLAEALGVDAHLRTVRSARVARGEPRALSHDEWARLLQMPDRRTRHGKRDLALLHLLGSAGLRRVEAANLHLGDVDERRRASDPRLRQAIKDSTSWWVTVRYGKRGRTRAIPLDDDALEAILAWVKSRPAGATEHLLLSLPRTGQPGPLSTRDLARIVAATPRRPTCPKTAAHRTCCATPSAPTSPTPAPTSAPFASSPATPTSAPPRSTPPSAPPASSTPSLNAPSSARAHAAPPPAADRRGKRSSRRDTRKERESRPGERPRGIECQLPSVRCAAQRREVAGRSLSSRMRRLVFEFSERPFRCRAC